MTISNYQSARVIIPMPVDLETFCMMLPAYNLDKNQTIGIIREWRAYWYLKSRFPKWEFEMSTAGEDGKGIDIIGFKDPKDQEGNDAFVTYQVGGPAIIEEKLCKAMMYLQVTDKKIYLRNGKVKEK